MEIKFIKLGCEGCGREWLPRNMELPERCKECYSSGVYAEFPEGIYEFDLPEIHCACGHEWTPRSTELPDRCRECLNTNYVIHQIDGNSYRITPGNTEKL